MNSVATSITAILTNIFSSASKLVFLMIATTLCIGLFAGKITQDNFIYLAASVFSYYFGLSVGGSSPKPGEGVAAATVAVNGETKAAVAAPIVVPGVK
jgi:hypothetical protein